MNSCDKPRPVPLARQAELTGRDSVGGRLVEDEDESE